MVVKSSVDSVQFSAKASGRASALRVVFESQWFTTEVTVSTEESQ
jgi:hypothetical protein